MKPAAYASPQPVVSTTGTSKAGMRTVPRSDEMRLPSAPSVAATQPTPRRRSVAAASPGSLRPVMPLSCSTFGMKYWAYGNAGASRSAVRSLHDPSTSTLVAMPCERANARTSTSGSPAKSPSTSTPPT